MAQWSQAERTLYAKLVYYGPAVGGKTTNLKALHRLTDPAGATKLLSVNTADDRTLFFDLLPFELGTILGYRVALKLYTVPGQVRYEATRRTVLAGADAVVFVADSTRARAQDNRASLESLKRNMQANRLDPARVPVIFQFNKQDVPDAALPEEVASWLGVEPGRGFPAVAVEGRGVVETFIAACQAMLHRLVAVADASTRRAIRTEDLARQIESVFASYRVQAAGPVPPTSPAESAVVPQAADLLEQSLEASVRLGEDLVAERERSRRLEREADALRKLGEALREVEASFDRRRIVETALDLAGRILGAAAVSLVSMDSPRGAILERSWGGRPEPLLATAGGRRLLDRLATAARPCLVEDLVAEVGPGAEAGLRAAIAAPVGGPGARMLLAYAKAPDGRFGEADVRFLATVAAHLAVGLEKERLYAELARHRDRLEEEVAARTRQLRRAYEDLRTLDRMKDRFLSSLSHEMRTPLAAILSAAAFLADYDGSADDRHEMIGSILASARLLDRLLDRLFRVARLEGNAESPNLAEAGIEQVVGEALRLAGSPAVAVRVDPAARRVRADPQRLARAIANLLDNAVKFSPPGSPVELRVAPAADGDGPGAAEGIAVSVLDRGPGVPPQDRARIFSLFEQGGDLLTSKPSGLGLGLYEARAIARLHGGEVVYREREGGGSEFRLVLPPPESIPAAAGGAVAAGEAGCRA